MNKRKDELESPYLHWQLRLGLLSVPVSSSLNISPNEFDELEGGKSPPSSHEAARGQSWMIWMVRVKRVGTENWEREKYLTEKRSKSMSLLLHSRRWSSDTPHATTSSRALQNGHAIKLHAFVQKDTGVLRHNLGIRHNRKACSANSTPSTHFSSK